MAESIAGVAVAASITQLSRQILESATKIHSFWKKLQGDPKQVSDLLEDILGFVRMISNMPEQNNEMVKECCLKVKRIMDKLLYLMNMLQANLERNKHWMQVTWARAQGGWEAGAILRELTEQLEKAKAQLLLANSFYQT